MNCMVCGKPMGEWSGLQEVCSLYCYGVFLDVYEWEDDLTFDEVCDKLVLLKEVLDDRYLESRQKKEMYKEW